MGACRLARPAISYIDAPFLTFALLPLCGAAVCLPDVLPRFRLACYYSTMSGRVCFFVIITNVFNTVSGVFRLVWFGWLLPVVRSLRHTAQTLFSAVVTCKVYLVYSKRCTANPICHFCTASAEVYYCAGRALNPIVCVCLSRGRRHRSGCVDALQAIGAGVCAFVPFDNAKLIRVFVTYQIKKLFSFVFIHLYIFVKVYWLNL